MIPAGWSSLEDGVHAYGRTFKQAIVDVMRSMYQRGLVQVRGGNASIIDRRTGRVYISPSGVPRMLLGEEDVAVLAYPDGTVLEGTPSSEWRMHLKVYMADPNAVAVVHAHPKNLLSLLYRGGRLDLHLLSEAALRASCSEPARVPFITPGTEELARAVYEAVVESGCNIVILERHGALVYSRESVYHALDLLEALEDLAYIQLNISDGSTG
ncbi:MAG: class II aldolase/adducin family protein [Desulfurococcales archaeon]|nr:class II aldolase/adducin family protein [Desulfurococcales archaeon]